jgi:hypothetical protein
MKATTNRWAGGPAGLVVRRARQKSATMMDAKNRRL